VHARFRFVLHNYSFFKHIYVDVIHFCVYDYFNFVFFFSRVRLCSVGWFSEEPVYVVDGSNKLVEGYHRLTALHWIRHVQASKKWSTAKSAIESGNLPALFGLTNPIFKEIQEALKANKKFVLPTAVRVLWISKDAQPGDIYNFSDGMYPPPPLQPFSLLLTHFLAINRNNKEGSPMTLYDELLSILRVSKANPTLTAPALAELVGIKKPTFYKIAKLLNSPEEFWNTLREDSHSDCPMVDLSNLTAATNFSEKFPSTLHIQLLRGAGVKVPARKAVV
jgi:hypothetical protein